MQGLRGHRVGNRAEWAGSWDLYGVVTGAFTGLTEILDPAPCSGDYRGIGCSGAWHTVMSRGEETMY